ncbi:NADH:flavin oxidoreductase/NADH oxidase [Candidimonas nitroreducens]|uniref:NADH:flavin oxidoreductase / NADH oxidase n=1 Tax=Candidimonas nitroreducens TaxID=683354 RepID=A0A225MGM9_9BURK|nr:NADH:flavin oxidoreductase/NADH oxidase [Candidimonas nitroreducens]OWT59080.1 NADH:flavin oxidoreductase / NADH oxidase [Candidimonas nitroreducens]
MSEEKSPRLFSPLKLRSVELRNRVVVSPMCQYMSVDGAPTDWHLVHLGKFAIGGAGLVFGEETAIEPAGRKTYDCAGLWADRHVRAYRRINDFLKEHGATPGIQLGHSGFRGSCHGALRNWEALTPENTTSECPPWTVIGPSVPRGAKPWPKIREMDRDNIAANLKRWREATLRSVDAGFQVLEIHGAHGYLIHEFLSPITNHRTDAYGGDLYGRMRFALEVTEVVREAWPLELPLFFRVSAVDGKGGVWNIEDTVALAHELKIRGVDVIDCSSGGVSGSTDMPIVPRVPGYHVDYAREVKHRCSVATMAVGLITDALQAEDILRAQSADLIALARELMWNPHWASHAAKSLGLSDPFSVLPESYGFRLRRREAEAQMPWNQVSSKRRQQ